MVLEWQITPFMIGIYAFTRLVLGQYFYDIDINTSIEIVCSIQMITMSLLMLDLLFASLSFEFIKPNFFEMI